MLDLSDLLTASGTAMGASNQRLRASGAPALLQTFNMTVSFGADFVLGSGDSTLIFTGISPPNAQMQALTRGIVGGSNVTVNATFIAAPSLVPSPPKGGTGDP